MKIKQDRDGGKLDDLIRSFVGDHEKARSHHLYARVQGRNQQLLDTKIESRRICVDQYTGRAV